VLFRLCGGSACGGRAAGGTVQGGVIDVVCTAGGAVAGGAVAGGGGASAEGRAGAGGGTVAFSAGRGEEIALITYHSTYITCRGWRQTGTGGQQGGIKYRQVAGRECPAC
jgi:hypothetical protein